MPERDVPGINANICENPISSASFMPMVLIVRCWFPTLSDNHSSKPKKIVVNEHSSLKILEDKIKLALNDYYTFAFVRNPYHWIVSYFWWYLYAQGYFILLFR